MEKNYFYKNHTLSINNKSINFLFILSIVFFSSCNISVFFQQKYYKDSYHPIQLGKTNNQPPKKHFIEGITCFSYDNPYCQSASLQMFNSLNSDSLSIHYYNWVMGFTYGGYFHNYVGIRSFLPSNDPEIGLIQAEEYIGYKKKYYITNSEEQYKLAIKQNLSENKPLRIALNSATMVDEADFYPHSILLVGYNEDNIIYYETGGENRTLKNYEGKTIKWQQFLKSVISISEGFNYPWKYQLTEFDKVAFVEQLKIHTDTSLFETNGFWLKGDNFGPVAIGAKAIESLASYIAKNGIKEYEMDYLKKTLMMGERNRNDNAMFLKKTSNKKLLELASYMAKSSKLFTEALNSLEKNDNKTLSKVLLILYENETSAGQLLSKN